MKSLLIVFSVIFAVLVVRNKALKCIECSGSLESECAKGLQSAGIAVKCDVDPPPPLPENMANCGPVFNPIPACITYSNTHYNALEKNQQMVYRMCAISGEDFCKNHLEFNKESMCRQCNDTDYCF